jgi:hypothetical protein
VRVDDREDDMADPTDARLLSLSDLSQKDRIQILQSEYAALRAEIVARTGFGFQIGAVALAGITWFMQQPLHGRPWWFWVVMGGVLACFGVAIFVNLRDISRPAFRLKAIEHEINSRAGEHLLVWETLSGIVTRAGIILGFFRLARPLDRSALPALDQTYLEQEVAVKKQKASVEKTESAHSPGLK